MTGFHQTMVNGAVNGASTLSLSHFNLHLRQPSFSLSIISLVVWPLKIKKWSQIHCSNISDFHLLLIIIIYPQMV